MTSDPDQHPVGLEDLFGQPTNNPKHTVTEHFPRHFEATYEIYCNFVDETVVTFQSNYVRHCPMCGCAIDT